MFDYPIGFAGINIRSYILKLQKYNVKGVEKILKTFR